MAHVVNIDPLLRKSGKLYSTVLCTNITVIAALPRNESTTASNPILAIQLEHNDNSLVKENAANGERTKNP